MSIPLTEKTHPSPVIIVSFHYHPEVHMMTGHITEGTVRFQNMSQMKMDKGRLGLKFRIVTNL